MRSLWLVVGAFVLAVEGVRLPHVNLGTGYGLARGRAPVPPPSGNNTAALYQALRRDIVFIERFAALVLRTTQGAVAWVQEWFARSVGFPPRVMVVSLNGVILAEEDARMHSSLSTEGQPELLDRQSAWAPRVGSGALRQGDAASRRQGDGIINLARVDRLLTKAFNAHGARAVCLLINSPGGSPAQSSLIYQRLRALRKQHKRVPLLAFVEDAAVSGGYYIACAADEIIADPSSLVGSIGVISRGFGYVKAIQKQGVERRVQTAGESKSGIDPYLPAKSRDKASQKRLLAEIHTNFIGAVKEGRGERLQPEAAAKMHHANAQSAVIGGCGGWLGKPSRRTLRSLCEQGAGLFDGSVYSGEVGLELGLVDGVGEMRTELQRRFGRFVRLEQMEGDARIDYSKLLRWLF